MGLPLADLRARRLNESELTRIIVDVSGFAREWGARHFAATARRVRELQPGVDLYELLLAASPADHALVLKEIEARPDPVVRGR
jgi:hypothetical protein